MSSPEKFNLALPPELIGEFRKIVKRYPRGGKTATITAAMLALLRLPRVEQDLLVAKAAAARMGGKISVEMAEALRIGASGETQDEPVTAEMLESEAGPIAVEPTPPADQKNRGSKRIAGQQ